MGIVNYTYNRSTSGGEIITHLINAKDGQGLHFDGAANTYVDCGDTTILDGATKISIEAIAATSGTAEANIITKSQAVHCYRTQFTAAGTIQAIINNGTSTVTATTSGTYNDGNPKHIVATWDNATISIYINGNLDGTATLAGGSIPNTTDKLALGAQLNSSTTNGSNFDGTIYRARLWNKSLTAAEVTASFENAALPFSDQYGSQTELMANNNFSSGDTGWNKNAGWTIVDQGGGDYEAVATSVVSGNLIYQTPAALTAGKKYRLTYTVTALSSGGFNWRSGGTDFIATTRTTVGTFTEELTIPDAGGDVIGIQAVGTTTGRIDDVSAVEIGCVADYDLAFANPTQSDQVQDRSTNLVDGTASAGVTQVTKIEAVNTNKLNVGGTTPKFGLGLAASATPDADLHVKSANFDQARFERSDVGSPAILLKNSGGLLGGVVGVNGGGLEFRTNDPATTKLTISDAGKISAGVTAVPSQVFNARENGDSRVGLGVNASAGAQLYGPSDATNPIQLGTIDKDDGTTFAAKLTIDSAGNAGLGGSPTSESSVARYLYIGDTASAGIVLDDTNSTPWDIYNVQGSLYFAPNGGAAQVTISAAGLATFSSGIAFQSATTGSGTGTGYTLDSYEEGTFGGTGANAILQPATSGSITCGTYGVMSYTKVGRMVTVQGQVVVSAVSSPVGPTILNLPFPCRANGSGLDGRAGSGIHCAELDFPTSCTAPSIWLGESVSYAYLQAVGSGVAWSYITIASAAAQTIAISFSYQTT